MAGDVPVSCSCPRQAIRGLPGGRRAGAGLAAQSPRPRVAPGVCGPASGCLPPATQPERPALSDVCPVSAHCLEKRPIVGKHVLIRFLTTLCPHSSAQPRSLPSPVSSVRGTPGPGGQGPCPSRAGGAARCREQGWAGELPRGEPCLHDTVCQSDLLWLHRFVVMGTLARPRFYKQTNTLVRAPGGAWRGRSSPP